MKYQKPRGMLTLGGERHEVITVQWVTVNPTKLNELVDVMRRFDYYYKVHEYSNEGNVDWPRVECDVRLINFLETWGYIDE